MAIYDPIHNTVIEKNPIAIRNSKRRHKTDDLPKKSLVFGSNERTSLPASVNTKGNNINVNVFNYDAGGNDVSHETRLIILNLASGVNSSKAENAIKMATVNNQFEFIKVVDNNINKCNKPNEVKLHKLKKKCGDEEIQSDCGSTNSSEIKKKNNWYKMFQRQHILPVLTLSNSKYNPLIILRNRSQQNQQQRRPPPLYTDVSLSQKLWNHITTPTTYVESICDIIKLASNIRRVRLQLEANNFSAEYWDNILGGILFFPLGQCIVKNYYERTNNDQHIIEAINMNTSKSVAIKVLTNRHLPSVQMELACRRKMSRLNDAINKTYEIKYYKHDNIYHIMMDSPITSLKYLFKYCKMYSILLNFETIILKIWIDVFENVTRLLKYKFQLNSLSFSSVHLFSNYKFCIIDYFDLTDSCTISVHKIQYLKQFMLNTLEYSDAGKIQQKIIYNALIDIPGIKELEIFIINLYKRFFFQKFDQRELNNIQHIADVRSHHFESCTRV